MDRDGFRGWDVMYRERTLAYLLYMKITVISMKITVISMKIMMIHAAIVTINA